MKKIIIVLVLIPVLGFLYYAISPLFNTVEVDDALPDNIVTTNTAPQVESRTTSEERPAQIVSTDQIESGFEDLSPEKQEEMKKAMDEVNAEAPKTMDDDMPEEAEEVETLQLPLAVPIQDTFGHPASGEVKILKTTDGGAFVRYENLETINGPNLHIYLAKDLDAEEFIDLGPIKGTEGNINYEVPEGVNIDDYQYVMHWCVPFGVLFNYAEIN